MSQQLIDREFSGTLGDQGQQQGGPAQVGGPGLRVNEDFDDRGHDQQAEGGEAGEQAGDQQQRQGVFGERRERGGDFGWHQGQHVFVAEQVDR